MNRNALALSVLVIFVIAAAVVLVAWGWLRAPDNRSVVRSSSFSSFSMPDHLDAAAFEERLRRVGFVAVPEENFKSLLPADYHAAAAVPAAPAPDFAALPAYRHTANSKSHTRILGYDLPNRRIHYYHAHEFDRESAESARNEPDTIE